MQVFEGLAGAPGRAAGRAAWVADAAEAPARHTVPDAEAEVSRLRAARKVYAAQLELYRDSALQDGGKEAGDILEAYREIVQDDYFFGEMEDMVRREAANAGWVLEEKRRETVAEFEALDDAYLSQRASDINNVCRELMAVLSGGGKASLLPFGGPVVVFAEDLSPTETMKMDKNALKALVTERGGPSSHTSILAKSLGIPAVVGVGPALRAVQEGDDVLVDGEEGSVVWQPDAPARAAFSRRLMDDALRLERYQQDRLQPAVTRDGVEMSVCVNWGGQQEGDAPFDPAACDGVGLFRTEFLFMRREGAPDEAEQYEAYCKVARQAEGRKVVIRTMDIGGDKTIPYLGLPREQNPFLGYRAIRISLHREDLFRTQLRAVLRAATQGDVRLMFPMVVTLEELQRAKALVAGVARELEREGIACRADIPVGIMVETPAAVFLCDQLARAADFFSIGTNDLIQYTTATDRMNEKVQYLFDECNISVLRAVNMVCESGARWGTPVSICGEAASNPLLVPLWAAMGVRELSVAPALVARTKYILNRISVSALQSEVALILGSGEIAQVKAHLQRIQKQWEL